MDHGVIDSARPGSADPACDPIDDGRALQDRLPLHCFGRELRARVVTQEERKSVVACSVRQGPVECATAQAVVVRVRGLN